MADHRIVILTRDGELPLPGADSPGGAMECISVPSGYEAAAELLAEPALALVVDLALLTVPHRKLLHVARQTGAELFGVGAVPAGLSAEDLSGMRLVSASDLAEALHTAAERSVLQPKVKAAVRLTPAKTSPARDDLQHTTNPKTNPDG